MNAATPRRPSDPAKRSLAAYAEPLLAAAEAAVDHGLAHGMPPHVNAAAYPAPLREPRGVFVTLLDPAGELRGCLGQIEGDDPLVAAVSECAWGAAFRDPRFAPLTAAERAGLRCRLSVLTPPEPIDFASEADLVEGLEPGLDGILIDTDDHRGTLLPAVWHQLPEPAAFWQAVKRKAGLSPDELPRGLAVYHYRAEELG